MAILVDKIKKKKEIALSCKSLLENNNINSLTISSITKVAGIGKGTFYEYFKNKEELIFEIVSILMQEYNKKTQKRLKAATTVKEKLKIFAQFFYSKEDENLRKIYNQFLAISLNNPSKEMIEFQSRCFKLYQHWIEQIIKEAINSGELDTIALEFSESIFATIKGFYLNAQSTNQIDTLPQKIDSYIDRFILLIGKRK